MPKFLTNILNLDTTPALTDNEALTSKSDNKDTPKG